MEARRGRREGVLRVASVGAVLALLATSAAVGAEEIVSVPGVVRVEQEHGVTPTSDGGNSTGSSGSTTRNRTVVDPDPKCVFDAFGQCLFELDEYWETEDEHHSSHESSWFARSASAVDSIGLVVGDGAAAASLASRSDSAAAGSSYEEESVAYHREYYSNNIPYSEEEITEDDRHWAEGASSSGSGSRSTEAGTSIAAPVLVGGASASEGNASSASSVHGASRTSTGSESRLLEIPVSSHRTQEEHDLASSQSSASREARADGVYWLVNPLNRARLEILAFEASKGTAEEASTLARRDRTWHEETTGPIVTDGAESVAEESNDTRRAHEWLRLVADVQQGALRADVLYDRRETQETSTAATSSSSTTFGITTGDETSNAWAHEARWRSASVSLGLLDGVGVVELRGWDGESSTTHTWSSASSFAGQSFGSRDAESEEVRSHGLTAALALAGGEILWLNATYLNETTEHDHVHDATYQGDPMLGSRDRTYSSVRRLSAQGGSGAAGSHVHASAENSTTERSHWERVQGQEFLTEHERDEHVGYAAGGGVADGLFTVELLYVDGRRDSLELFVFPVSEDYRRLSLRAGGELEGASGERLLVYGAGQEHTSSRSHGSCDGLPVFGCSQNATRTDAELAVLPDAGAPAGASASHAYTEERSYLGQTEFLDESGQEADAEATAGPTGASAGGSAGYLELADRYAVGVGGSGSWSTTPGVPDTRPVTGLLGETGDVVEGALGLLGLAQNPFFVVPLLPAHQDFVVPIALGLAFGTAEGAGATLPAEARGPYGVAVSAARAATLDGYGLFVEAYEDQLECWCNTIPDQARASWALEAVGALSRAADPLLATGFVHYDGARPVAYDALDEVFRADALAPAPPTVPALPAIGTDPRPPAVP